MNGDLERFLNNADDWDMVKTTVPGLFIQKVPANQDREARLVACINPINQTGTPTKKVGIRVWNAAELNSIREVASDERTASLIKDLGGEVKVNGVEVIEI